MGGSLVDNLLFTILHYFFPPKISLRSRDHSDAWLTLQRVKFRSNSFAVGSDGGSGSDMGHGDV